MILYTEEEIEKFIEMSPTVITSARDISYIRNVGTGQIMEIVPSSKVNQGTWFVFSEMPYCLQFDKDDSKEVLRSPAFLNGRIKRIRSQRINNFEDPAKMVSLCISVRKLLYETNFEDVPLWINSLPIVAKWRLEIKK
jgi:hypothetical protein